MAKKRRVLIGTVVLVALVTVFVTGLGGQGAWVEPPKSLREAHVIEDKTRITRTAIGTASSHPVRLAIRQRVLRVDMPSDKLIDRLKRQLPASEWPIKEMVGEDRRRSGVIFLRHGLTPPQSIQIIVWVAGAGPSTRVEYQEIREATKTEQAYNDTRGLLPRR